MNVLLNPKLIRLPLLVSPALLLGIGWVRPTKASSKPDMPPFAQEARPLTRQFCLPCHSGSQASAQVNLGNFTDTASVLQGKPLWRRALEQVRTHVMPPSTAPQPTSAQRAHLVDWLTRTLDETREVGSPRSGRVLIHRLSRTEYNNTVRDLLGVDTHPADQFPGDGGGGGGFDNDADTLFVPPILMERYLAAAGKVLAAAKPGRIFIVRPGSSLTQTGAAHEIIARFASRAFRRPVMPEEMQRLMHLYEIGSKHGRAFETGVKLALKAALVSPHFLFRVERDRLNAAVPYPISDYEMASRLSYFLWASMPDDTLFTLAAQHRLHRQAVLDAQVQRMLRDPKCRDFADSFVGQWLHVRDLYTSALPDPDRFKDYNPALRDAMYGETVAFFHSLLRDDGSLLSLIDCDYTYANETLARYYGLPGVQGAAFRRVALPDRRRGGVLTMASVLTVTAYPQRTSPVLRGKWVLGQLLGSPVPPPPPGAGGLPVEDAPTKEGITFRQRLEQHRHRPECASCHSRMDPIGFGLENFDAIGRWRDQIGGKPIDASGVLATGEKFTGPIELKRHMLAQKDEFLHSLTEKMLAYALGRGLETYDLPTVSKIAHTVAGHEYRAQDLILQIVKSVPFQFRENL